MTGHTASTWSYEYSGPLDAWQLGSGPAIVLGPGLGENYIGEPQGLKPAQVGSRKSGDQEVSGLGTQR